MDKAIFEWDVLSQIVADPAIFGAEDCLHEEEDEAENSAESNGYLEFFLIISTDIFDL